MASAITAAVGKSAEYTRSGGVQIRHVPPQPRRQYLEMARWQCAPGRGWEPLAAVAREVDKTPAQTALNWCLYRPPVVVIPKTNSVGRTEENCGASGWSLTPD